MGAVKKCALFWEPKGVVLWREGRPGLWVMRGPTPCPLPREGKYKFRGFAATQLILALRRVSPPSQSDGGCILALWRVSLPSQSDGGDSLEYRSLRVNTVGVSPQSKKLLGGGVAKNIFEILTQ